MSTLNQVLSGLHETDLKMYNAIGLSAMQKNEGVAVPILNSDQRIDPTYNSLKIETVDVEAVDQLKKIKFIGNCKITSTENGEIILRIGDNLNSSTFNTKDGQTTGFASYSRTPNTALKSATLSGGTAKTNNIWVKGTNDSVSITTSGKIHLDDNTTGKFKLYVETGAGTDEYVFGPITTSGYYANGAAVSNTAPTGAAAKAYLRVTNMAEEAKTAQGATGYEANVTFTIDVDASATTDGEVKFRVEPVSGMVGAANYPQGANSYQTVAYYLNDNSTTPTVSGVSGILPEATGSNIQTWSGLTSIKGGTVTYKATFADLNNPATSNESNSSIKFDNTKNFSDDVTADTTTYSGEITKTTTAWTDGHYTSVGNSLSVNGSNINGTTNATGKFYGSNGAEITEVDVYQGTPDASVKSPIRTALNGTAFDDAANLGSTDLMMYHGYLQHPSKVSVTTSSYGNSSMVKPSDSNDKIALFHFTAIGTENGGNVQLSGESLTSSSVKLVEVGNSIATLRDVTKNTNGGMGDKITTGTNTITYQYTFPAGSEVVNPETGCWIRITLASTSNAKIAKIMRNVSVN